MNILAPTTSELNGALELLAAFSNPAAVKKALEEIAKVAKELDAKRDAVNKTAADAEAAKTAGIEAQAKSQQLVDEALILRGDLEKREAELASSKGEVERFATTKEGEISSKQAELEHRSQVMEEHAAALQARESVIAAREEAATTLQESAMALKLQYEAKLAALKAAMEPK